MSYMLRLHESMNRPEMITTLNSNFQEISGVLNTLQISKKRVISSGDISTSNSSIQVDLGNIRVILAYKDSNDSKLSIAPISTNINVDITHKQITNTAVTSVALQNQTYSIATDIVGTVANDSNGTTITLVRDIPTCRIWEIKTFISGNGSRATLWAELVI